MLKDYLKERKLSMYRLAEKSGVPYATVNDLCNGRVEIERCRAGILRQLAAALGITMDALYALCDESITVRSELYNTEIYVLVKNKTYYAEFPCRGKRVEALIGPVNTDTTCYITTLALWTAERVLQDAEWEEINALLANA